MTKNYKCQSAVAVNSAVAKMFANVSVNEVADKFINKMRRSDKMVADISVKVSDDVKVQIGGTLYGEGNYLANVHIFQKGGNGRYYELGKKQIKSDVANSTGVALSEVYYGVQDMMIQIAEEQSDDVAPVLEKTNLNENPQAGIDVCEYVILNGKNADWNDVFNTIKDMKIDGEYNADIAVLLNKIEQGVYGITLDEDMVCKSLYLMLIGYFMQLRGMLIEIREYIDENGMEDVVKNDTPCLEDCENVRDYFEKNNDERAFFVLPDYDYVCGLFVEYNEDDDVYVAMGNESWNATEYDGDTDMNVVIADFSNAWAKEIDEYCDFYKGLDYDRKIYRNDDYDAYMILLNSGVDNGLNVEEGYDPYKADYVEVIA